MRHASQSPRWMQRIVASVLEHTRVPIPYIEDLLNIRSENITATIAGTRSLTRT